MEKARILVVDDDKGVLQLIEETLGETYEVLTLSQGEEVEHVLPLFEPDLVILDVVMPGLDGYGVIDGLKENRETARIPVIFLSAKDCRDDIKMGYGKGAQLYLTKPFQPERLRKNISLLFEQTPPAPGKKSMPLEQVQARRELLEAGGPPAHGRDAKAIAPDDEAAQQRTNWLD